MKINLMALMIAIVITCSILPLNLTVLSCNNVIEKKPSESTVRVEWTQKIGNDSGSYPNGFGIPGNIATRGIGIYRGELYIGTQNLDISRISFLNLKFWVTIGLVTYNMFQPVGRNSVLLSLINLGVPFHGKFGDGCEMWKYNYTLDEWVPLVSDRPEAVMPSGFGNNQNFATSIITEYKGRLYIGTGASSSIGCEIWRWDGTSFEKIVGDGFGDRLNSGTWCSAVYNDELYIGTMNWDTGCQIWKTNDGITWTKMNLPKGDGFGSIWNVYAWSMGVYKNSLFVGTCNINRSQGCQLWRYNGSQWVKMNLPGGDGFGDADNYGIRNIVEYKDEMYISSSTSYVQSHAACEIWKFDGAQWYPVVVDRPDSELGDGFNNLYNKYAWSMIKTSSDTLMIGTFNLQPLSDGAPFNTYGCEIWSYDGTNWKKLVGNNSNDNTEGGFGNNLNIGARSMLEYPENSGCIWVGTLHFDVTNFSTFDGCEIWKGTLY